MNGKKIIWICILILVIIAICGSCLINYLKDKQASSEVGEYVPQEEISDEQLRRTMVNLYFYNNDTGKLEKESRLVDVVELIENPYIKLVQMLIDGPKNENLKTLIPEGTQIAKAELKGNCVTIDMSIDILNHTEDRDLKDKMINCIVNTLTELTEVDSVRILINGNENAEFNEEYVKI